MEDRAIMPEIEHVGAKLRRQKVPFQPGHRCRGGAQTGLSRGQRRAGEVEHGEPVVAGGEEAVDQR